MAKKQVVRKQRCIFGDPNCTTYFYSDGSKACVMLPPKPRSFSYGDALSMYTNHTPVHSRRNGLPVYDR